MPFPYLDMYALNTHPNPKHLTLQTTIHRKKKLYVLKDMGRTHDSHYSILQTSILIIFKICTLYFQIKYQRFRLAVSTNSYISTYFYFAYNQQFGTLYLMVQAVYIYIFCFCMNKDNVFAVHPV